MVKSLRMRLFIIFFVVGLVPCVILHYGILNNYETRAVEVRTEEVETHLRALANHLISYDYLSDQSSELIGAELAEFSSLYDGRILVNVRRKDDRLAGCSQVPHAGQHRQHFQL